MRGQLRFELARSVAVASLCPVPTRLRFFAAQAATPFTKSSKPKRGRRPSLSKSHAVFAADRSLPAKGSSSSNTSCCGKRFRVRVSAVLNGPGRDSLLPQRRLKQAAGDVGGVGWAALLSALSGVLRLWQSSQSWSNSGTYSRVRATAPPLSKGNRPAEKRPNPPACAWPRPWRTETAMALTKQISLTGIPAVSARQS